MMRENGRKKGLTRRSFLKATALTVGTVGLSSNLGCSSISTEGAVSSGNERIEIGGCMYAGCASCQAKIVVRDEKVVNIMTNPDEVRGNRPCLRGRSHINRIYGNQRIKYPMRRVGERGSNEWERISWDEAIEEICTKWKAYTEEFGPQSIVLNGSSNKGGGYLNATMLDRLRNITGWTLSMPCNDFAMAKGMNKVFGPAANTWGFPPFEIKNLIHSNAMISWSGNISVASTQDWRHVLSAKENGVKIVCVDPVYTVTAQIADLWVHPHPGTDTILIFSLIQHIIENELYDKEYTIKHTVAPVLIRQDTKKYLRMSDLGVTPTEGSVNPQTGKPTLIDPPAQWDLSTNSPVALETAVEPTIHGSFTANGIKVRTAFDMLFDVVSEWKAEKASEYCRVPVETIVELAEICADTPLYHYIGYGSQSYNNGVQNGHALATLGAITGNVGKLGAGTGNGWHGPVYNLEYAYPTGFGKSLGVPTLAMYDVVETGKLNGKDFPVKSLYLPASAIVGGSVDTNRVIETFIGKTEFVVCQDIVFSDTARYADILLPVSHNFECSDIFSSGVYTLWNDKIIDPLYESLPDGEIIRKLAKGLGLEEYFNKTDDEYLEMAFDSDSMRAIDFSVDRIKKERAVRFLPEGYIANADGIFPTDTKRLEFYVDNPTPRVNFGQEFNGEEERLPRWFPPTEAWHEHEIMKEYPLIFMSERARNRYHTQNYESEWLLELEGEPIMRMNPVDAETRGLIDGDYIYVENTRGHAVGKLSISSGIQPGVVIYPKGWQIYQFKSGCWGGLHNSEYDPVGLNSSYYDSVCEVSKWDGEVH